MASIQVKNREISLTVVFIATEVRSLIIDFALLLTVVKRLTF